MPITCHSLQEPASSPSPSLKSLRTTLPLARVLDALGDLLRPALDATGRISKPVAQRFARRARRARDRVADPAACCAGHAANCACEPTDGVLWGGNGVSSCGNWGMGKGKERVGTRKRTPTVEVTNLAAPVTPVSDEDVLIGIVVDLIWER